MDKDLLIYEMSKWSSTEKYGYFITLDGMTKDKIKFEQDLSLISHKLNDYCFGRSYKRKDKRLKIIAGIENGRLNGILHAHLVVTFDEQMNRSINEIDRHVRKHWYSLIGLKNSYGSMVDIRYMGNLNERIAYITKDTNYLMQHDSFNIIVL